MPPAGLYFEPVYEPLADATTVAEIEAWQPPSISDAELAWLRAEARRLRADHRQGHRRADRASRSTKAPSRRAAGSASWRTWPAQPALAEALLQRLADAACADLARYLDAVGDYHRHRPGGRRPGDAERPAAFAPHVPPARQAVPAADVAVHQGPQRPARLPALLRRDLSAHPRPDRGGRRHPQPGADLRRRHGPRPAQAGVRPRPGLLGRRLRHPTRPARSDAGGGRRPRPPADRHPRAGRRVRLQPGAQHPGQRAAREHRRHAGRGACVRRVTTAHPSVSAGRISEAI